MGNFRSGTSSWFPGKPYPGHDVDEKIPVEDLHRGTRVLVAALADIADVLTPEQRAKDYIFGAIVRGYPEPTRLLFPILIIIINTGCEYRGLRRIY